MNPLQKAVKTLQTQLNQSRQNEHLYEYSCTINNGNVNIIQRPVDGDQEFKTIHQHLWGYIPLLNPDILSHRYLELNQQQYQSFNRFLKTLQTIPTDQLITFIQQNH